MLGEHFAREIAEQPAAWQRIADSAKASDLAAALRGRAVLFVGSGSSLFVGQLGALALRRRGIDAAALPATEAAFDIGAYQGRAVVALSQSGRSGDLLNALDLLRAAPLIALTNSADSPLANRADVVIDLEAGRELAVPASKSVTTMVAIVLWSAALLAGKTTRSAAMLTQTADEVKRWLGSAAVDDVGRAAKGIAGRHSVVIVGAGYGVPIAHEFALKMKEASYVHAEGFAAGEFRHGSGAMLDRTCAIVGIVDDASRAIVRRPLAEALRADSLRYVVGAELDRIPLLGPVVSEAFNTLAWLVAAQVLALEVGRARRVESDAPRGQTKFVT